MAGKSSTQNELFEQIEAAAKKVADLGDHNLPIQAAALRNLALAYRFAAGGNQPGAVASD